MRKMTRSKSALRTGMLVLLCTAALTLSACTGEKPLQAPSPTPAASTAPVSPSPSPAATEKPVETPKTTETPRVTPTPAAITAKPSATAKPTATPKPTATAKPTEVPKPTATAKPTATPKPTVTPAPHVHTVVVDPGVEATCKSTGLTEGTHCSTCGAVLTARQVIPAVDHYYLFGQCVWCGARDKNWSYEQPEPLYQPDWEESDVVVWSDGSIELPPMPIS